MESELFLFFYTFDVIAEKCAGDGVVSAVELGGIFEHNDDAEEH